MTQTTAHKAIELLTEVAEERVRQDKQWGGATHDDEHPTAEFVQLIEVYAGHARTTAAADNFKEAPNRLLQVAALAVAAIESIDRKHVPV